MKLATFETDGRICIGAVNADDGTVVDFTTGAPSNPAFASMMALIDGGEAALDAARDAEAAAKLVRDLSDVRMLAALPRPRQMRDFMGYEKHVRQARAHRYLFGEGTRKLDPSEVNLPKVWYEEPLYYKCNRFSVVGTGVEVQWPRFARLMDYELELGVVLGKGGVDIRPEDAMDHVFGYIIFNDVSARDAQIREMQGGLGPAKGKDFDTGNILGPWLVTKDEIADPYDLRMVATINGVVKTDSNSGTIYHRFETMLARISADEAVHPGEFIGLGTVGDGCGLERGEFLEAGDVVELSITGLGKITNRIGPRRHA